MKTQNRLSYLLSQLIPTPGCLLLSCQHWEWQVENGIPPSAQLFYWIFSPVFILLTAFSDDLRIISFLHIHRGHADECNNNKKKTGKKVAEGKVGEEEEGGGGEGG